MTLAEMRALCRLSLADTTDWPNATLDAWIIAGIRLYSAHFPRRLRAEVLLFMPSVRYLSLPGGYDIQAILSVEYPADETPRRYCKLVAEDSPEFASGGDYYALAGEDATALVGHAGQLALAKETETGDTCFVEYLTSHVLPAVGGDATGLTVPVHHVEAITALVEFCALHELEADEAAALDVTTIALSQLGQEARRAWVRYKEVMDRLLWLSTDALQSASVMPAWGDIGL